ATSDEKTNRAADTKSALFDSRSSRISLRPRVPGVMDLKLLPFSSAGAQRNFKSGSVLAFDMRRISRAIRGSDSPDFLWSSGKIGTSARAARPCCHAAVWYPAIVGKF